MVIKGIEGTPGIYGISRPDTAQSGGKAGASSTAEGFSNLFGDMVNKVNSLEHQADAAVKQLATGESRGLHEVMIAMEKSSISFQFLSQVRNKALDAYHEIMRMQV